MNTRTRPAGLAAGILAAGLALAGCSSNADSAEADSAPASVVDESAKVEEYLDNYQPGSGAQPESAGVEQPPTPSGEYLDGSCSDALLNAANADHEPAGMPQDWSAGEPLPDPVCHPDFIEIREWDYLDDYRACWDGEKVGILNPSTDMTEDEIYEQLWSMSQARADWQMPSADTWEPGPDASPECVDMWEKHNS